MSPPEPLPLGLWPSAIVAALPIVAVFALLGGARVAGHRAALAGAAIAAGLAMGVWGFPLTSTLAAGVYGAATGLFPILYIIAGSLLLYNLTVASGWAGRLRSALEHTARDRYLLLLLIGFGFAAFLDSTAGFLTPVTVATVMLVGLGVPAYEAASYSLVASSLPPIFGAMGIPVVVLAEVAGLPLAPLARAQSGVAAALFLLFPSWLTLTFGGWRAFRRLWAHSLAAGAAYGCAIWLVASWLSPYAAGLAASVASLIAIVTVAWVAQSRPGQEVPQRGYGWLPWWPYLLLMAAVTVWSVPAVNLWLKTFSVRVSVAGLPGVAEWRLDLAASPGTAILLAALVFAWRAAVGREQWLQAARTTGSQLRLPAISMTAMFALAYTMNFSGMTAALGKAAANSGAGFPLLSPYLSWLGAAIAGSNTASNAMLGRVQAEAAVQLGLDPIVTVALAGAAAPLGKMVAPQVIAAAVGAGRVLGAEARLLRAGLLHSTFWVGAIALAGYLLSK